MTDLPSTERRCERCGIPSPSHSEASDSGGVSLNQSGVCLVCVDYKEEQGFYPDTAQETLTSQ
jgi:riboflavin synthase alpha subunit